MDYKNIPEDYVQVVKIIENGYKGDKDKMIGYMKMYLHRYPDGVYSKLIKALFDDNNNPDGLQLWLHDPCPHKWIRTTKNYKTAWKCYNCHELVTEKPNKDGKD